MAAAASAQTPVSRPVIKAVPVVCAVTRRHVARLVVLNLTSIGSVAEAPARL